MAFEEIKVTDRLAEVVLPLYGWRNTHISRLIMISENATYAIVNRITGSTDAVLRISRPGYHTPAELVSEVIWIDALAEYGHGIKPAKVIHAHDGSAIQAVRGSDGTEYYCIMFEYIAGVSLEKCTSEDIVCRFGGLGRLAAHMHMQTSSWKDIAQIDRTHFSYDNVIGEHADWGKWQDRNDIPEYTSALLTEAAGLIKQRLSEYGTDESVYGLIHADMRLANIIIANADASLHIIDFDDCGFGWYVSDYAASVSFIEERPIVPYLKDAWLDGYSAVRTLKDRDIEMLDTFVMMRRMQLTAWMAGHQLSSPVKLYSNNWIENTAVLAKKYLS